MIVIAIATAAGFVAGVLVGMMIKVE